MSARDSIWLGKWSIGAGITERGDNGVNAPWMGFCYGSWLPRFHHNGGGMARGEVWDLGWHWLCFHGHFTRWPHHVCWFWTAPRRKP